MQRMPVIVPMVNDFLDAKPQEAEIAPATWPAVARNTLDLTRYRN